MRLAAVLALSLSAAPAAVSAAGPSVPPAPTRFVTDKAGALSPDTAARLEQRLESFEKETSNQFLVYTERVVPDGTTLEEYTVACAQAWKAGQTQRKNGMILFVFPGSRKVRLEVGYGLEGALTDLESKRILDGVLVPRLRAGDWDGGFDAATDAILIAIRGEFGPDAVPASPERTAGQGGFVVLLILIVLVFLVVSAHRARKRGGFRGGGPSLPGGGWGGGGFGGGFGGGGFGGFSGGGGSFGGGGASGRW